MNYCEIRKQIYSPLSEEGIFNWDSMYGSEYALASIYTISEENRRELTFAAEELGKIFKKTAAAVQTMDTAIFYELGIPRAVIEASRFSVLPGAVTMLGRFDFARTKDGLKMLEFNSDTPGGIVEAFYVNGKVCAYYNLKDPNAGMAGDIEAAFKESINRYQKLGFPTQNTVFSALDWHIEDAGTTHYLMQQSGLKADFVPLKDLRLYKDKLCALCGSELIPIDVLYRLHPLGMLGEDADIDGFPTGEYVLKLTAQRKLALINPPETIIAQTKALQVLIWNLHIKNEFFSQREQDIIGLYMLPTYYENAFLGQAAYVVKPVFGREGGNVCLYSAAGEPLEEQEGCFNGQMRVYQEMAELEHITVPTLAGDFSGRLLWGVFLLGGKASAINARVGGLITNDMAYFLPVGMK